MYLTECFLKNVGPIESLDVSLPFNGDGSPKPVILVGPNGCGKTILLSHMLEEAFEQADPKTMVVIVFHLQNLLQERSD